MSNLTDTEKELIKNLVRRYKIDNWLYMDKKTQEEINLLIKRLKYL